MLLSATFQKPRADNPFFIHDGNIMILELFPMAVSLVLNSDFSFYTDFHTRLTAQSTLRVNPLLEEEICVVNAADVAGI